MMRLNESGKMLRNFIFADRERGKIDIKDVAVRISIIDDMKDQIFEEIIKEEPDQEVITACRDDIEYQAAELRDIFRNYPDYAVGYREKMTLDELMEDVVKNGRESSLQRIIDDWTDIADFAEKVWDRLDDSYGRGLDYMKDDLCEIIMDEIYDSKADSLRKFRKMIGGVQK